MKYFIYILTLFVYSGQLLAATTGSLPQPKVIKFNDQIYMLQGPVALPNMENRGYMSNSAVIIGQRGVILVDTGFSDEIGRLLKKTIAGITPKPVTHIINTHHHGDHMLGNSEFPNAEIISAEKCRELVKKSGYEWIGFLENATGHKFPYTRPVPATKVFPENTRHTITLQGISMQLWVPHGAHTPGDMMVYLPQFDFLISGDILVNQLTPSFIDANVKNWINTLNDISKLAITKVIPGHGPPMNKKQVVAMHNRMAKLYHGIEVGYKKGLTDSEIRKTLDLSEWKTMKEFESLMGGNINHTYLEIEEANF